MKRRARLGSYDIFQGKTSVAEASSDRLKVRGSEYDLIPLPVVLRDHFVTNVEELPEDVRQGLVDVPITAKQVRPLRAR